MIARIVYDDTEKLDYWTDDYRNRVQEHKNQLVELLAGQPEARETSIREQQQEKINQARQQVKDSEQQLAEFNNGKSAAEKKIADSKTQIELALEQADNLTVPAYSVNGRREGLTSQGYRSYMIIVNIINKLANIFPIFLYFVAALKSVE